MSSLVYNCGDRVFQINMPNHGKAHEWQSGKPGSDLVNFHPRMFSLLRTTAIPTSVLVNVSVFYYITNGNYVVFPGGTYNLTSHIPATPNYVRLVLLGLDTTTNTLVAYQGTETFNSALTPPPLPTGIPTTFIPSSLIRVKYNAIEISELEISDARTFLSVSSGAEISLDTNADTLLSLSSGVLGLDTQTANRILSGPSSGSPAVPTFRTLVANDIPELNGGIWRERVDGIRVRETSIANAITNASTGDVIWVYPGTYTETLTVNKNITIRGTDRDRVTITSASSNLPTIDITTANAVISNLTIVQSDAGSINGGLRFTVAGRAEQVKVNITGAGDGTNSYGIRVTTTSTVDLINCEVNGTGTAANPYGLGLTAAGILNVTGGKYDAFTADIRQTAGTIKLQNPVLANSSISQTGGTTSGEYFDNNANLVVVGSGRSIKSAGSFVPDIGTTTLAEKWGNIYLGTSKDIFPYNDGGGLFNRVANWGLSPTEHWAQGADQVTWTGWAAYTGFLTPNNLSRSLSLFRVNNDTGASPGRAFYYKSPPSNVSQLFARVGITALCEAGIMIDDGNGNADGNGANNFIRIYLQQITNVATAPNVVYQYRTGGGAVTSVTGPNISPLYFYGLKLVISGTKFTNWSVAVCLGGPVDSELVLDTISGLTWTPARVGLYYRNPVAASARRGVYDFYGDS